MRNILRRLLVVGICFPCALPAQQSEQNATDSSNTPERRIPAITVITRSYGDSLLLRWAPGTAGAWAIARQNGYTIERIDITASADTALAAWLPLTRKPLLPWTLEQWKARSARENIWAALAAQLLYGKASELPADMNEIAALRARSDEFAATYGYALFAADMDAVAAEGLALRFMDRSTRPNRVYAYRVSLAKQDADYPVDTGYIVSESRVDPLPDGPMEVAIEEGDGALTLSWEADTMQAFTAFRVYRSADAGATWQLQTKTPIAPADANAEGSARLLFHTDSAIVNGREYRYRIRGITAFAEESAPTEIAGRGRDRTAPALPRLAEPRQLTANSVRLSWTMDAAPADLASFIVERSADEREGYRRLGDVQGRDVREFVDFDGSATEPYYTVSAVDTAGNIARSLPVRVLLIDSIPPAAPTGLKGIVDTSGHVQLSWTLGPEPDILGYRVLMANDSTHDMSMRTPEVLRDTSFVDSINVHTLTSVVFYRVVAVDARYNPSPPSELLCLHRPDLIPPAPSVFLDVRIKNSSIALQWAPSASKDLAKQLLLRRVGDGTWLEHRVFPPTEAHFVDTALTPGLRYRYQLVAEDAGGLRSTADAVEGVPYESGILPGVANFTAEADARASVIHLRWEYTKRGKEPCWFVIYRAFEANRPEQYKAVSGDRNSFDDADLVGEGLYTYTLVVMSARGESPRSAPVRVELKASTPKER